MEKDTQKAKLNIQLGIAVVLILAGVGLLVAGFSVPPTGEIHSSVLVAFGELCTFAGALIGVDYNYRYKAYVEERLHRHRTAAGEITETEEEQQ